MGFPKEIFGKCPVCGADAGDDPNASGADAPATDTTGNGVKLEYYNGDLMCQLCVKRLKADEESRISAERHAQAEQFRGAAGFTKTIT